MTRYLRNIAGGFGHLSNALLGGHHRETFSSRVYRLAIRNPNHKVYPKLRQVIDTVVFWRANHCLQAYFNELSWAERRSGLVEMSYE